MGDARFDTTNNVECTINSNFLDMAVIEWCKLFGPKEVHGWQKMVTDKDAFLLGLLTQLAINEASLDAFYKEMRAYRDKFLAHLDSDSMMNIPQMNIASESTLYYYNYILKNEKDVDSFKDELPDLPTYFNESMADGQKLYLKLAGH